jgi:hypothetical protein
LEYVKEGNWPRKGIQNFLNRKSVFLPRFRRLSAF